MAQAGILFFPQIKQPINEGTLRILPIFAFVLYWINGVTEFTQALFVNCDHSLLTYSFYKQPESILKLFTIRLREIIKVNLVPAGIIAVGMAWILFASGGTDNSLNYVVIFSSIICMSIFFSVHYLLQPYNAGTELKNPAYQVVAGLTYFVCYMLMQAELSTMVFGVVAIVFCVLYCVVACVHWGEEYRSRPSRNQHRVADFLRRHGADIVVGSHPHVVQPAKADSNGVIIYSLGNFVSNQRKRYCDGGIIAEVEVVKSAAGKCQYSLVVTPVWVALPGYRILPPEVAVKEHLSADKRVAYEQFMYDTEKLFLAGVR